MVEFISKYDIGDRLLVKTPNYTYYMNVRGVTFAKFEGDDDYNVYYFDQYEEDLIPESDIICKFIIKEDE